MKNSRNIPKKSIFLMAMALAFFSCTKENLIEQESSPIKETIYKLIKIDPYAIGISNKSLYTNIDCLLTNQFDADDTKLNYYMYEIALATKDLIKDPAFNQLIISMARQSLNESVRFIDLQSTGLNYYNMINANLAKKGLSLLSIHNDYTHTPLFTDPAYPLQAEVENYTPTIYIPNLAFINENLQPLFSVNIEVDCRLDTTIEDNVVAWYYQDSKDTTESEALISEEISLVTPNPLFFMSHERTPFSIEPNMLVGPAPPPRAPSGGGTGHPTTKFYSKELNIKNSNYRYESCGKSEFAILMYRIDPNGTVHRPFTKNNGVKVHWSLIRKVKTSEMNSNTIDHWFKVSNNFEPWADDQIIPISMPQTGVNVLFFNTFERDWNRGIEPLGYGTANGGTTAFFGNMKYSSDYYAHPPGNAQAFFVPCNDIYSNWSSWFESYKSKFRFWRVE